MTAKLLRESGIPSVGEFPWGAHFCQFFESDDGNLDAVIPFLLAGLRNREACLWIMRDGGIEGAKHSIQQAISRVPSDSNTGALEILPASRWYTPDGAFDPHRVIRGWEAKLEQALESGFEGLRVAADLSWLRAADLDAFVRYEEEVDRLFADWQVIVMCCHVLPRQTPATVLDLCHAHGFSIDRSRGRWRFFEAVREPEKLRDTGSSAGRWEPAGERHGHLWFLEGLDRANRAMQSTHDHEQVAAAVVEASLAIFDCDRAWLLYPCEPEADSWRVVTGQSRPPFPMSGMPVAMTEEMADAVRIVRDSGGPVTFGPQSDFRLPPKTSKHFGVQSAISTAVRPKIGKPYAFGLHQCSRTRVWTTQEKRLLEAVGQRLADTLTSLLVFRDLQASEARFRTFVDHATDAFFLHDDQGRIIDLNRQACESLGRSRDELIGKRSTEFDLGAEPLVQDVADRLNSGDVVFESRHLRKDGTTFPVEVRVRRFEVAGRFFTVSLCHDITERLEAKRALVESHTLLNAVVEGIPEIVFVKDLDGRYLMVNSSGARFLGRKPEEVVGRDDSELLPPDAASSVQSLDRRVLETGLSQVSEETLTLSGAARTFLSTRGVYRDATGKVACLVGISREITETKLLDEQFRESKKLEAVGRLAGGIAHEFNNLLTVINGHSELLLHRAESDDRTRYVASHILNAGERATKLVGQLLAYGRKQMLQPSTVNLNAVLPDLVELVGRAIGDKVRIVTRPDPDLGFVKVDRAQFEQAIVSLLMSVSDSLPQGEKITIETRNTEWDATSPTHPGLVPGSYVQLTVTDSGPGLDSTSLKHIFEPFHSSRQLGGGLDLAMVYGFVRQSEGHIKVSSEPGGGTTFHVYLPRVDAPPSDEPEIAATVETAPEPKTILVVEDEEAVRALVVQVLASTGFNVLEAQDGNQAVAVAKAHQGRIDLLLTDLVLPGADGHRVAEQLIKTRPGLRILFMSGYTEQEVIRRGLRDAGEVSFIRKPFSPSALIRTVREVLGLPG